MNTKYQQDDVKHFVEDMGLYFEQAGLPRMAGRVLGWLLISNPSHQTMQELTEALHASKASISNTTRMLVQMGFIERISLPGHRRDHYRIKPGVWYQITKRKISQLTIFRELAERGLNLLDGEDPQLKSRLEEMHNIYVFFEQELPSLFEQWAQDYQQTAGNKLIKSKDHSNV